MTSPILALRAAIRTACAADAALAALMDPDIRDEAPPEAAPVHATFGDVDLTDASSSTERGHEQELRLLVFARSGSAASGLAAAERLVTLLGDAALTLTGHRLVSLGLAGLETRRETTGVTIEIRLRAVTEVAP